MRLMLSSHPNIAMTRRTYLWTRFYGRYGDLSRPENLERCLAAMLQSKQMRALEPDPDRIRREFWQGQPTYARLFALIQEHFAERMGKSRWGDQLAFVEHYADPIFAAYPDAKMIHMIRDPRDRFEDSMIARQHRTSKVGWDIARWLYSTRLAKRNQQRYPDRYKIVRYEALASQPEETLREVCHFLNEEFSPGLLTMENAIRFGENDGHGASELQSNAASRNGEVPAAMTRREVAFMQTYAGRELMAWGYRLRPIQFSLADQVMFRLIDWPANLAGILAWRLWGVRQSVRS